MKVKVTKAPRYTFIFNDKSVAWTRDKVVNDFFLLRQQDYANEKLKSKGYLFLNDVLDILGLPRTKIGQVVGWVCNDKTTGDQIVDFGILKENSPRAINGGTVLNFNVDGNILNNF